MSGDKEALMMTFAFETIMGQVTQVRPFSRIAPYIDQMLETWGSDPAAMADFATTAQNVVSTLHEAYQMIDMTILQDRPTVGLLLERDVLNALRAHIHLTVHSKASALLGSMEEHSGVDEEMLDGFRETLERATSMANDDALTTITGRTYYKAAVEELANKLNVPLTTEG